MTEEINYSYDGGFYAELVRNRTFRAGWSGILNWFLIENGTSSARVSIDAKEGPSTGVCDRNRKCIPGRSRPLCAYPKHAQYSGQGDTNDARNFTCRGADSGYNIRVGRSRKVTGPFLDADGMDMIQGGGKLLIGSGGRLIGPVI